jgi:heme/copper-type cytochrome/quinol oxidase subunit 3
LYFKVLFMTSQSQADQSLEALQDIRRMMERSSRFISLSGLSGLCAGICALVGAFVAHTWMAHDFVKGQEHELKWQLIALASAVLIAALASSSWFTWRKARRNGLPIWDHASKKLVINMLIPLAAGGFFILGLFYNMDWQYVAPACLVFYGLALVNASKYTLTDIRYLGMLEIVLGCLNMYYPHGGLYFWAVGFGVLHIIYGLIMWWKYERGTDRQ